jgi:guanine deaminase
MRAYRGTILNPRSESHCALYADGLLVVNDAGQVGAIGSTEAVTKRFGKGALEIVESNPAPLILPAFTDVHFHWVQNRVKGTATGQGLLPWLNEHVWPEETRFADAAYARDAAVQCFTDLARSGTMVGAVYSSIHETALEAFTPPFGHFVVGNVMMTENAPRELTQTEDEAMAITERAAAARVEGGGGGTTRGQRPPLQYAVSPRFAPTCSMALMKRASEIAKQHGCFVQTHLAENLEEIAWVHKLFPDCHSYTEVYHRAGLLGPRTILAHCIYLDDDELAMLKAADAVVAHCPTSNEALGSGRMPIERIRKAGIRWALASDIAAGPSLSMLHVMKTFLRVHAEAGLPFTPVAAFYRATLAGAEALGSGTCCGNLDVGKEANFLLLDAPKASRHSTSGEFLVALLSATHLRFEVLTRGAFFRGNPIL